MSTIADVGQSIAERVREHADRAAKQVDCWVVSVRYTAEAGGQVLRVVIDKNGGVDVEDCARVSRQLSTVLDVEDSIRDAYTLEVSSPGLDQALLVAADYRRFAGRTVRIEADGPVHGSTVVRGVLRGLRKGSALVEDEAGTTIVIPLRRVVEARLEVEI